MSSSVRGVLVAGGTAVTVLVVGLVFVGVGESPPAAKPALSVTEDESTLSLEARRQARLSGSQAMLGVPQAPVVQDISAAIPPDPQATPSPDADTAPRSGAEPPGAEPSGAEPEEGARRGAVVSGPPRGIVGDGSMVPSTSLPSASPAVACTIATSPESPVGAACQEGGRAKAKRAMKDLVKEAKKHGAKFVCQGCHVDLVGYTLHEDARSEFTSLLAAATK